MAKKSVPPAAKPALLPPLADETVEPMKIMEFRRVPQVGMNVQYTVTDGQRAGAVRAAIITAVFHEAGWETDENKVCWEVNLTLFPNLSDPSLHEETHPPRVPYNEDASERQTWRFIQSGISREIAPDIAPPAPTDPPATETGSQAGSQVAT